ncbi:MAG: S-layer homology domain-containing protein [Bacillota bacterium]|nr:S-layer homology domain-containing protein [Bacillota bacterium]
MNKRLPFLAALIIAVAITTAKASGVTYSDIDGHWAKSAIETWSNYGIFEGSDEKFGPDEPVTRGELAVILDRLMKYQVAAKNTYSDLSDNFYTGAILKLSAADVIKGYPDGTIAPEARISRKDAAVMISRAFCLEAPEGYMTKMTDSAEIAGYAKGSVAALEAAGCISGRNGGRFYPTAAVTRAEIVYIFDKMISKIYTAAGIYTESSNGVILVNMPEVTLKNITVPGTLVVGPGVGDGNVYLDSVNVTGRIVILGGGTDSVKFINNSKVTGSITVKKVGSTVRIFTEDGIELPTVYIDDGCSDVILDGEFTKVQVEGDSSVNVSSGTSIGTLYVTPSAANSVIKNSGTITNLKIEAKVFVSGTGTIEKAVLTGSATGSTFENRPDSVEAPGDTKITIGNSVYVSDGIELKKTEGDHNDKNKTVVSSVTLYINGSEMKAEPQNGTATFDLKSNPDGDIINGIKISTNKDSTYTVNGFSISTNKQEPMSTFLAFAGFSNIDASLKRIRVLGGTFSFAGDISDSNDDLTVIFKIKPDEDSYYSYDINGTELKAVTLKDAVISTALAEGCDPAARAIKSLSHKSGTYTLKFTLGAVSFEENYTYAQLETKSLSYFIDRMKNNKFKSMTRLNDLKGVTIKFTSQDTLKSFTVSFQ